MNLEQIKRNVGYRVKLAPPAYHLDAVGEPLLPVPDADWTIMSVTDEYLEIVTDSGAFYRLGKDHVRNFTTDPHRSRDGREHAFLVLHMQLYIQGSDVRAVPNNQPGVPVPPSINPALRARVTFIPELERVFRRQVQILDRVIVNFMVTSNILLTQGDTDMPGDTWQSLKPFTPRLFPSSAAYRDLTASDAGLLAEFYGVVEEIADIIEHWTGTIELTEYNAWNVMMHKVETSLRLGEVAVQKFCPDRAFDATMPAVGTLLSQSQRVLASAGQQRNRFMERFAASQKEKTVNVSAGRWGRPR